MARSKKKTPPFLILKVMLWGREVGKLFWDDRKGVSVFAYNRDYIPDGPDVSPLENSTKSPTALIPRLGDMDSGTRSKYNGLPPFIADSLPDKWGNDVFNAWADKNGYTLSSISPVHKLAFIGSRGMGALEYVPEENAGISDDILEIGEIIHLAAKIGDERAEAHILAEENLTLQSLYLVGTSAGGQRKKAIIALNRERNEIRSGQVMDLEKQGFSYCILKFNEREDFPSAEIEAAYHDLVKGCGINMMPSDTMEVEGVRHFLTERFDRRDGEKVFTQTLAAVKPGVTSYEELFSVCRRLGVPECEIQELFRRMVFDILSGNTDDHDKNISFIMNRKGAWHLSPAYDVTFTTNIFSPGPTYRMRSVLGKRNGITIDDLMTFAENEGIRNAPASIEKVCKALVGWRKVAEDRRVFPHWIDIIERHISQNLPMEYASQMEGWKMPPFEPYIDTDGHTVGACQQ